MGKIDERYYDGFEDEKEIIFTLVKTNGDREEFGVWDGYFNTIIQKINLKDGMWIGLAYYYHLCIGWEQESPWLVKDLKESYEQLKEIDMGCFEYQATKEVLKKIIEMFEQAINNGEKLYITED